MAGAAVSALRDSEFADIQGLVHAGYANLTEASYLLLRVTNPGAARAWLATAPVTSAAVENATTVLQVACSAAGLRALEVPASVIAGFSLEFLEGMAGSEARSRRLGDIGTSAPAQWRWGGDGAPDMLVMLFARTDLAAWRAQVTGEGFSAGFVIIEDLTTTDMAGREPFGFIDGVSQPSIDWAQQRTPGANADYGNLISPGEFVLGYPNEYGLYTARPLVDAPALPPALDIPGQGDLGRNGSYLVFRQLHQDVRGFWRWVAAQTSDTAGATHLAEAMVGRHESGAPLLPADTPIAGVPSAQQSVNGFTYMSDPLGMVCPAGAHVRRANPRTGDIPGGRQGLIARLLRTLGLLHPDLREDLIAASRFHRLLRRGREFGAKLSREEALRPDAPDPNSGLHFICLAANIARQFEFIQNAWLMSAKFGGLDNEPDPLLGNRDPGDSFSTLLPNGPRVCRANLPKFVTVTGGAYFFLPGLRALAYIAKGEFPARQS